MKTFLLAVLGVALTSSVGSHAESEQKAVTIYLEAEKSATFGDFRKAGVKFKNPHYVGPGSRPSPAHTTASPTLSLSTGAMEVVLQEGEREALRLPVKFGFGAKFVRAYPDRENEFYEPKSELDEKSVMTSCTMDTIGTVEEISEIAMALSKLIEGEKQAEGLKVWVDHKLWKKQSLQHYSANKRTEDLNLGMNVYMSQSEEEGEKMHVSLYVTWLKLEPSSIRVSGAPPAPKPTSTSPRTRRRSVVLPPSR